MSESDLDSLWNFQDPAGSETKFRSLLDDSKAISDFKCEVLTQLARSLGLQRRFEEAHKILDEASAFDFTAPRPIIRIALERGRVLNSSGKKIEARPYFENAWRLAAEAGEEALE